MSFPPGAVPTVARVGAFALAIRACDAGFDDATKQYLARIFDGFTALNAAEIPALPSRKEDLPAYLRAYVASCDHHFNEIEETVTIEQRYKTISQRVGNFYCMLLWEIPSRLSFVVDKDEYRDMVRAAIGPIGGIPVEIVEEGQQGET